MHQSSEQSRAAEVSSKHCYSPENYMTCPTPENQWLEVVLCCISY